MLAAIDGDYIPYLCAGSTKVEERYYIVAEGDDAPPLHQCHYKKDAVKYCEENGLPLSFISHARHVIDEREMYRLIDAEFEDIFRNTGATKYQLFLGGSRNFRHEIYPYYKISRESYSKPVLIPQAKRYMVEEHGAKICEGIEADDAVSIVCSSRHDSILCSPDKDLDQIAGMHYDPGKGEVYVIDEEEAISCLYSQILTGDSTDSIPGVKGVGVKRAQKLLAGCKTPEEMWEVCVKAHGSVDSANLTASLVYTLRHKEDKWKPPCG